MSEEKIHQNRSQEKYIFFFVLVDRIRRGGNCSPQGKSEMTRLPYKQCATITKNTARAKQNRPHPLDLPCVSGIFRKKNPFFFSQKNMGGGVRLQIIYKE